MNQDKQFTPRGYVDRADAVNLVYDLREYGDNAIHKISVRGLYVLFDAIDRMDAALKEVPSERGEDWIRCFDRLPETPGTGATRVLVWVEHDSMSWIAVRFYNNRKWWANGEEIYGENITHWMPLPEPPK